MKDPIKEIEQRFGLSYEAMLKVPVMFQSYKKRAKDNGLQFTIPFAAFDFLLKQPCYYCKVKKPMDVAGIDRVDNSLGYVSGNCLSSCWDCNRSKSDKTLADYCDYLKRFNSKLDISANPMTIHWNKA